MTVRHGLGDVSHVAFVNFHVRHDRDSEMIVIELIDLELFDPVSKIKQVKEVVSDAACQSFKNRQE